MERLRRTASVSDRATSRLRGQVWYAQNSGWRTADSSFRGRTEADCGLALSRQAQRARRADVLDMVGKPISPNNVVRRWIIPACETLGLERVTWLTLRRTYSSWAHEKGVPGKVIAQLMGHAKVDTTLNVYTQVVDGSLRRAADAVGSELFTIVHKPEGAPELTQSPGCAERMTMNSSAEGRTVHRPERSGFEAGASACRRGSESKESPRGASAVAVRWRMRPAVMGPANRDRFSRVARTKPDSSHAP